MQARRRADSEWVYPRECPACQQFAIIGPTDEDAELRPRWPWRSGRETSGTAVCGERSLTVAARIGAVHVRKRYPRSRMVKFPERGWSPDRSGRLADLGSRRSPERFRSAFHDPPLQTLRVSGAGDYQVTPVVSNISLASNKDNAAIDRQ